MRYDDDDVSTSFIGTKSKKNGHQGFFFFSSFVSFLQRLADCKRIFNPRIRVYVWCANGNFGSVLSLPPVNSVFSEDRVEMTGTTVACLFKARDVFKGRVLGRQSTIHMCNENFRFAYNLCTTCRHHTA